MSHDIINEQQEIMVLACRRALNTEINERPFYSIICDEATDIAKTEQMSFSLRHCDEYNVREDCIGIIPCDKGLDADSLILYIQDILTRCRCNPVKMIGCAFDGATVMKCLAKKLKSKISPTVFRVHCFAHCNELVFKDASKASTFFRHAQDLCEDLYALIGVSPKRVLLFEDIQENTDTTRLRNLSRTWWTTRGPAADIILKKHANVIETLDTLKNDPTCSPECRAKARGLSLQLQTFSAMFGLRAMHHLANGLEHH